MSSPYDKSALRKQRTDLWVGLFVFLGLAFMGALVVRFGSFSDRLRDTYYLYVTYPDAGDIVRGAPVRLGGAKVGVVSGSPVLNDDYTGVKITLEIHREKRIPVGSKFSVSSSGLMGDLYIRIKSPAKPSGKYFKEGASIKGDSAGGLDKLQEEAGELSDQVKVMMADISKAVQAMDKTLSKIDNGLLSDENVGNFKDILADLKETGENFKESSAKLGPLLDTGKEAAEEVKEAAKGAKVAFAKAGETFDTTKEVIKKAEPAMEKLDPTITELKETLAKINAALDKVTQGPGTAAALISDKELKDNLESFISNLNKHGILRYKNDNETEKVTPDKPKSDSSPSGFKKWFSKKR
jgi:phospholipid/cholesterol/gamma-HCH transport system substrate-binding protein